MPPPSDSATSTGGRPGLSEALLILSHAAAVRLGHLHGRSSRAQRSPAHTQPCRRRPTRPPPRAVVPGSAKPCSYSAMPPPSDSATSTGGRPGLSEALLILSHAAA